MDTSHLTSFFAIAFTTLLTTVNPVESLGPFLGLTEKQSAGDRRATASRAVLVSTLTLFVAALCGSFIFRMFGITLPAFRIAGGILLFSVGIGMLNAQESPTPEKETEGVVKDIAIFPLAIPLIAGPGAIASILILSERAKDWLEIGSLYLALFATQTIMYLVLTKANRISKILGPVVLKVMTRLMGLILCALATQFVLDGLREAFPFLAR